MNESSDFHPKDFVNSVVPGRSLDTAIVFCMKSTHRLENLMFANDRRPAAKPVLSSLKGRPDRWEFGTRTEGDQLNSRSGGCSLLFGRSWSGRGIVARNSCNMSRLGSSGRHSQSPSWSRSCSSCQTSNILEVTCGSLDKVVPQDACWVLQHPNVGCNLHLVVLYRRSRLSIRRVNGI